MQRIQNGEDVPLEEFAELSFEQKDVLKAQIQAVKNRNLQQTTSSIDMPQAKRGRKMGGGQKGLCEKRRDPCRKTSTSKWVNLLLYVKIMYVRTSNH